MRNCCMEQIGSVLEEMPADVRRAFEVEADGSFKWQNGNPMLYPPNIRSIAKDEMAMAGLVYDTAGVIGRRRVQFMMWEFIRNRGESTSRRGFQMPKHQWVKKGNWHAHLKDRPVSARDVLENHYKLD